MGRPSGPDGACGSARPPDGGGGCAATPPAVRSRSNSAATTLILTSLIGATQLALQQAAELVELGRRQPLHRAFDRAGRDPPAGGGGPRGGACGGRPGR